MTSAATVADGRENAVVRLLLIGAALATLTLAGPLVHRAFGSFAVGLLVIVCGAGAAWAFFVSERASPAPALLIVLGFAVLMRVGMLFAEPYYSTDLFRYIWDGRVQAAGINPYRYVPAAPELESLRDAVIFPEINRVDYAVTIYPPAAQMIFWIITRFGESALVMKAGMLAFDGVTIAALIAILRLIGKPPACVVAYAWHPLPIWEVGVNGHVDAAMVAFMVLGLLAALRGDALVGGVLATIGALVKPIAVLALPVIWRPWDWRLPLAVVVTIVLLYLPYLGVGSGVFGFVNGYAHEEGISDGRGFWLLSRLQGFTGPLPAGKWLYLLTSAGILAGLALHASLRTDRSPDTTITSLAWLVFAFLFLLSPDYPWYFLALVPFLPLTPLLAPWVLTSGAMILYHVIDNGPGLHDRQEDLLYGTALLALAFDLWAGRARKAAPITEEVRR